MFEKIKNAEKIIQTFNEWPSFHDAEVHRVVLDRSGSEGPTLEAQIHVFKTTNEVNASGHYVHNHDSIVTFRFTGVDLLQLDDFNRQNVLSSLDITSIDPGQHEGRLLSVRMPSIYGLDIEFECMQCEVTDVHPYDDRSS